MNKIDDQVRRIGVYETAIRSILYRMIVQFERTCI
jgi:hypothetical protein